MKGKRLTRGEAVEHLMDGKAVYIGGRLYNVEIVTTGWPICAWNQDENIPDEVCDDDNSILARINDYRDELYKWVPDPEPGHDFNWALEQAVAGKFVVWDDCWKNDTRMTYRLGPVDHAGNIPYIGITFKAACRNNWQECDPCLPVRCFTESHWRLEE